RSEGRTYELRRVSFRESLKEKVPRWEAEAIADALGVPVKLRENFGGHLAATFRPQKLAFSAGEPVLIDFEVKNEGPVPLRLQTPLPSSDLSFRVMLEDSILMDFGEKTDLWHMAGVRARLLTEGSVLEGTVLEPGGSAAGTIRLEELFEFSRPGAYTVLTMFHM